MVPEMWKKAVVGKGLALLGSVGQRNIFCFLRNENFLSFRCGSLCFQVVGPALVTVVSFILSLEPPT